MISAVAFVPQAPLLVPQVTGGITPELDELRAACRAAIIQVAGAGRQLVVIGSGPDDRRYEGTARGSLAGYGVALEVPLGRDGPGRVELPASLTVGAWLVRAALGPDTGAVGYSVADGLPDLWDDVDRALVVVGDGSARRTEKAPGYLDERAAEFDAQIADALRRGQGNMLHPPGYPQEGLHAALLVAGAPVWDAVAWLIESATWDAELLYDAAPFGVGYFVAVWTARD